MLPSNSFDVPLMAVQLSGPAIASLPLPQRILEKNRIKLTDIEHYLEQATKSSSKRIIVTQLSADTSADESTLRGYMTLMDAYAKRDRALAFDAQSAEDRTARCIMYIVPPRSTSVSPEFVHRVLHASRPVDAALAVCLMPAESYQRHRAHTEDLSRQMTQQEIDAKNEESLLASRPVHSFSRQQVLNRSEAPRRPVDPRARARQPEGAAGCCS